MYVARSSQQCLSVPGRELVLGDLDGVYLLRDDRQHLGVDAVELVETAPRARLRHAAEELAQHLTHKGAS